MTTKTSYAEAGVDIDAGNRLVERIKPLVQSTARDGADTHLGGFGGLFDLAKTGYSDPLLVAATDGVGTKIKIAQAMLKHDTIGIDLVAMCANDLVVQGAEPLFFLDYFATGKLTEAEAHDVISGVAEGCKQAGCALIGGETAEMPGMYHDGEYDIAGFCVGAVERKQVLPKKQAMHEGDVIIGIASNGIHSNGYSLVRHLMGEHHVQYTDIVREVDEREIGHVLLTPTRIYVDSLLKVIAAQPVTGLAHITGGGLTENLPRVLPANLTAEIDLSSWKLPKLFKWLRTLGNIETTEMLRTFNCGIGMVLITPVDTAEAIITLLNSLGEEAFAIGELVNGDGGVNYLEMAAW